MARFQCIECDRDHGCATGCPRCRITGLQVEICHTHGARAVHSCGSCRTLTRTQTGR